jgi:hypothetical protein
MFDEKPAGDVSRTTIASLGLSVEDGFGYWFDFGDDWWHQVTVEAMKGESSEREVPQNYQMSWG